MVAWSPMTKSDLIATIARRPDLAGLVQKDAQAAVDCILEAMTSRLADGRRIEIRDFGAFSITIRPARSGRNPRTGESVQVPEKRAVHFKAGRLMKEVVDNDLRRVGD